MSTPGPDLAPLSRKAFTLKEIGFEDLKAWDADDHAAAFNTFLKSVKQLHTLLTQRPSNETALTRTQSKQALLTAVNATLEIAPDIERPQAKAFFERYFRPHRVMQDISPGLVTGYFEPELRGSCRQHGSFQIPVHKRPVDLVNLVEDSKRGTTQNHLTHARKTRNGHEPFPTRQQIECGALSGQNLEIVYLEDPVDKFFMQIQGSGLIELDDGTTLRLTYDGKNGHPYTSLGRHLIQSGEFTNETMTVETLGQWLRSDSKRAQEAMWKNKSYVFFRKLNPDEADGPLGVDKTTLVPGRSMAVDTSFHPLGTPIYVEAPNLDTFATGSDQTASSRGFSRLMIAQDVGSAITGPERGDIFYGTGNAAGNRAGETKHHATFTVLLPVLPNETNEKGGKA